MAVVKIVLQTPGETLIFERDPLNLTRMDVEHFVEIAVGRIWETFYGDMFSRGEK